jgi:hypothetical protein
MLFKDLDCFTSVNDTAEEFLTEINDTRKDALHQCQEHR